MDLHPLPFGGAPSAQDDSNSAGWGHCIRCGAEWNGQSVCHCAVCHLTFGAVGGFDAHRIRGQCLTQPDLRKRGYEPNDTGLWRKPRPTDINNTATS